MRVAVVVAVVVIEVILMFVVMMVMTLIMVVMMVMMVMTMLTLRLVLFLQQMPLKFNLILHKLFLLLLLQFEVLEHLAYLCGGDILQLLLPLFRFYQFAIGSINTLFVVVRSH